MDFNGRHVLVTGGTGALGRAVVAALLGAGAACHVPYRAGPGSAPDAGLTPGAASFGDARQLRMVASGDLADADAVTALYGALPPLWASIHLAGGFTYAAIGDTGAADLARQIAGNFTSCYLCCRAAVLMMRPGRQGGRIVNVAARPALEWRSGANMTAYTAAKAAVAALTAALAEEVAGDDILVNAVAPSIIDTAANRAAMPNADVGRWPTPAEVAATILFLASPDNQVTRGAIVPVYGRS